MTFGMPLFLVMATLPLALLYISSRNTGMKIATLPGAWARAVDVELRPHLAAGLAGRSRGQIFLICAIAGVLTLALARPLLDRAAQDRLINLVGRVIVVDMANTAGASSRKVTVSQIVDSAKAMPTALVAVAADAYTVVPLTTDRRHLARYLQVLEPSVMPEGGRSLHLGLAHAESVLARAGILVGQIILVTSGKPPAGAVAIAPSATMRVLLPASGDPAAWESFADAFDAEIAGTEDIADLIARLVRAAADRRRTDAPEASLNLTPWLTALAMMLWLGLFRRRAQL